MDRASNGLPYDKGIMPMPMLRRLLLPALTLASLSGCAMYASHDSATPKAGAQAKLFDAEGREAGFVTMTLDDGMLKGSVKVNGVAAGAHGIHIHMTGKCDAPGFTTAGGHLNPDGKQHGLDNPQGSHQGDLPNLDVAADGTGHVTFMAHTSLGALFDADGSAFVVHAGPDDNKTDPSGNSGGRILCGVLEQING